MIKQHKTLSIRKLALLKNNPQEYYEQYPEEKPRIILSSKDNLTKSYSHMPYLAKMPYDRNSRHPLKMCARYMALEEYEKDLKGQIEGFNKEFADAQDNYKRTKEYVDELEKEKETLHEREIDAQQEYWDGLSDANPSGIKGFLESEAHTLMFGDEDHFINNIMEGYDLYETLGDAELETWYNNKYREFEEAFEFMHGSEETGYVTEEYAGKIDNLINDVKNAYVETPSEEKTQQQIIENLEKIKDNTGYSPDNKYPSFEEKYPDLIEEINQNREDLKIGRVEMDISKKQMSGAKKKAHERNVALYEVANEKQNCKEVFDDGDIMGNENNPYPSIEEYIEMTGVKSHLNKDGTIQQDFLEEYDRNVYDGMSQNEYALEHNIPRRR